MLRVLGALFIMAGAGGFGCLMAGGLEDRAAILRCLVAALQHLESEITFACLPIGEALRRAGRTAGGAVGDFLAAAAEAIVDGDGKPLAASWDLALQQHLRELLLSQPERETLMQLGAVLGGTDREDQRRHLELARATLAQLQAEAQALARKNKRVWQYLGFSLGALAVVFLY